MLGMKYSVVLQMREPKEAVEYVCKYWEANNGFILLHNAVAARDYYLGGPPTKAKRMFIFPSSNIIVVTAEEIPHDD